MLQDGYIVVRFDHRSATAISKRLENRLHLMISGPIEMEDIVDGIQWLKSKNYIDEDRVGKIITDKFKFFLIETFIGVLLIA